MRLTQKSQQVPKGCGPCVAWLKGNTELALLNHYCIHASTKIGKHRQYQ